MTNYWLLLDEAYGLLHSNKINESEDKFKEIYNSFNSIKRTFWDKNYSKFVSCLLWLWEINMKKWQIDKALPFYIEWNKLTEWKDFNILFNLAVVYKNLNEKVKCKECIDKAKLINPTDSNLIKFISEFEESNNRNGVNKEKEATIDVWFETKIEKTLKDILNENK